MAVGVGLQHCHEGTALGQGLLEDPGIVAEGVQVDLLPGPGVGGERHGPQEAEHPRRREAGGQDGQKVPAAVFDEHAL